MSAWSTLYGHGGSAETPLDEDDLIGFLANVEPAQTVVPAWDTLDLQDKNSRACVFFLTHSYATDASTIPCSSFQRPCSAPTHCTGGIGQYFARLGVTARNDQDLTVAKVVHPAGWEGQLLDPRWVLS